MELTTLQKEGLKIAVDRYYNGENYTVIGGFAGSGKSTLIKYIIDELALDEIEVCYTAFTGKAAQVLIDKGNPNAKTLHKLLFKTFPKREGNKIKYVYRKRDELPYRVVVVDECSMAPKKLVDILLSYKNVYVIFTGDPGQLPPVSKDDDNHLLDNPHIFLSEIMRQAQDSGIIQLSMKVRNNEIIGGFSSNDAKVLPKSQFVDGMLTWADQILCATNAQRIALNTQVRQIKGYSHPIEEGESLICLKNNWDIISEGGAALTNGIIGTLHNFKERRIYLPPIMKSIDVIEGNFISDTGEDFGTLIFDKNCIITGEDSLTPVQRYRVSRSQYKSLLPLTFTYSYAITCHKAQGSEFNNVLVIEERFPYNEEEHSRWLYTAVTRGSKRVVVIK